MRKLFRPRNIIILLVIVVVFFIFRPRSPKPPSVSATVKRGRLEETLIVSGKIASTLDATVKFSTSGKLIWVGTKEGDFVRKGQIIATLDQRDLRKRLDKYLNNYLKTRYDFDQAHVDNNPLETDPDIKVRERIKRILQKYQADLNNSVLDVEIQSLAMEYSRLTSPINGIVVKVEGAYPGTSITPTDTQFEIIDPKSIYFQALADQSEVSRLSLGKTGSLTLDPYPDSTISGKISYISFIPDPNETTASYIIHFNFNHNNSDLIYKIGMTGDLTFVTNSKDDVLYLPNRFIKFQDDKKYVTVLEDKKLTKKFIETGMETDNLTEILSGLWENEIVYTQ